jgi:uncharacterized protein (TIGR03435 family)
MRRRLVVLGILGLACGSPRSVAAQTVSGFAVASVKPSAEATTPVAMLPLVTVQPGRLSASNATLRALVRTAYGVEDFQIDGGPAWSGSQRFDITANAPGSSAAELAPMLRTLLADRFGLRTHIVQREMPVFFLVRARARADGPLGPDLVRSAVDCSAASSRCGVAPVGRNGGFAMRATGQGMGVLARLLSQALGQPVFDRTGLDGVYDFELAFDMSDLAPRAARYGLLPPGVAAQPSDNPPLLTAIQEQLGLKLERQRSPVDVIVIDAATVPVAD